MEVADNPVLYKLRHSLAHVLAQAVKQKYPSAKLGFGPPTDTGFFYDFDFGSDVLSESDLKDIEKSMKKIIRQKQSFERSDCKIADAVEKLSAVNEPYKVENAKSLADRGVESFSFYENGSFVDLCEGPHVGNTGDLADAAFKLDRIAGAYWLGNENNKMLTRIYALAFEKREELDDFLKRRQLAQKFDHKKLGKELDIYTQNDLVGKGLILWMPNGTIIRDEIEKYACETEFKYGYKRVATPHIAKADLYKRSQHLPAYKESMFPPMVIEEDGAEPTEYYLKPMNCPHHHLIFDARVRSYRELPIRLAEYGVNYRYEQSGELSGLIRVRCMTLNDAHIYLTHDQFKEEFRSLIKLYQEFYDTFKLTEYTFRLSIRGEENKDKFKGDDAMWTRGETLLAEVLDELGIKYYVGEGEGAFYGPKVDIQFKNLMGREETVSTIQVDYLSPVNFDLKYIDEHGAEQTPLILHRSPLSTHERFISFLMEYYGGAFPTWCAPVQVTMIPVNENCHEFANELKDRLRKDMIRVEIDTSANSFNKKIRTNTVRKIPNILIIGDREVAEKQVTIRRYGIEDQETLAVDDFVANLKSEISERKMLRKPMASIL